MTIELPNLDDRRFKDLVDEVRALIPRYAPEWTDHNASDPGITLIELFAWVTESIFYRANRAHEASQARLLELLGADFKPARPASITLNVVAHGMTGERVIPAGETLTAVPPRGGGPLVFETIEDLWLRPSAMGQKVMTGTVEAWQMVRLATQILGSSDGQPFQRFALREHAVIQECDEVAVVPSVFVAGQPWTYKANLEASRPGDTHFTVDAHAGAVRFGDSVAGMVPTTGSEITAAYHYCVGERGSVEPGVALSFDRDLGLELQISVTLAQPGIDPTTLGAARIQAITALRTPYRAIGARDFEHLVLAAHELDIARVKCLPGMDLTATDGRNSTLEDHVSVIIVPNSAQLTPAPSPPQLSGVHRLLDQRRLITCRHHVVGPAYTEFRVIAQVLASTGARPDIIEREIATTLRGFFDPLTGGPGEDRSGWPFGRDVHVSEVHQVIEGVEGVDHVEQLALETIDDDGTWVDAKARVDVAPRNLVYLTACDISIVTAIGH